MNTLIVRGIRREQPNRLAYDYTVKGPWRKYFAPGCPMWVEYDRPVDQVPDAVAVLPLLGNVIVLASLMQAEIRVEEVDKDFYDCIEDALRGYDEIMPEHVHFKLRDIVRAKRIVETPLSSTEREPNLLFFSGGVDATYSMLSHLKEKPALVTIGGADIPWDDERRWKKAIELNAVTAAHHGLPLMTIRSNFRKMFHEANLEQYSMQLVGNWWWPAFHHSIAMMGLTAPIACGKREKVYLASSFSEEDMRTWGMVVTASAPQIDNHVRFCGAQVVHDGSERSRYGKIGYICSFYQHEAFKPFLRVCYHSEQGTNCGVCEKCIRDIMSMQLAGYDPTLYGFQYDADTDIPGRFADGLVEMAKTEKVACMSFYREMQEAYRKKYTADQVPDKLKPFYESDLEALVDSIRETAEREKQQAAAAASRMTGIRRILFKVGEKIINHVWPCSSWKQEYNRLRWWHICSNEYRDTVRPWFERMLKGYQGELFSRGWRIRLDYHLCWIFLGAEPDDYFKYEFFRKGWRWRNHHITKQRLNFMDATLNRRDSIHVLANKIEFYERWNSWLKRKWCIPQQVSFEEFQSCFGDLSRILVKPTALYGGKGIYALDIDPFNLRDVYDQLHHAKEQIIVEEYVHQKGYLHDIHPQSLNTLRVCTLRISEEPEACFAFFRTGCGGCVVDNVSSGGLKFPIDVETGVMGVGHGMTRNECRKHPDTGIAVAGQKVPDWQKIKEYVCHAHRLAPEGIRLIGWDVCWNDGELSLIEGNITPGLPEPQRDDNQWKRIKEYLTRATAQ